MSAVVVPDWGLFQTEVGGKGRGVFTANTIPEGALVLKFEGPVYDRGTCPDFDLSLQVDFDAWMFSSGGLDDLVNHSCNPNTGVYQPDGAKGGTYLRALREIPAGAEICFDYSTVMVDDGWSLDCCLCGEVTCRGGISDFLDIPADRQAWYAARGALPAHAAAAYRASQTRTTALDRLCVITSSSAQEDKAGAAATDAAAGVVDAADAEPQPLIKGGSNSAAQQLQQQQRVPLLVITTSRSQRRLSGPTPTTPTAAARQGRTPCGGGAVDGGLL